MLPIHVQAAQRLYRAAVIGRVAVLALSLAMAATPPASVAAEAVWDGTTYLQVPVRQGSDTRLVMPEPFDDAWERESDVACTLLDARTLIIRPRNSNIDQRLTLRGRRTGTLYLARVSSSLSYSPIVTVRNLVSGGDETPSGRSQSSVLGLLKAMMQGHAPAGYQVQRSQRVLFDQSPFRIVAQEVWRSQRQTGIVAQLSTANPAHVIPLVPANLAIRIPELGVLRAMAADNFELDATRAATSVYLVYAR